MAARKKAGKAEEPVDVPPEVGSSGDVASEIGMSKETQMHLFRALSEFAIAADGMIPKNRMPEEAKKHATAAKKEILLMIRALIDAQIECVDKGKGAEVPKLKKIKVE